MDVGLSSKTTIRYINISQLANHLDHHIIDALPVLHAFTGCDHTAAFINKGKKKKKKKAFELIQKDASFTVAFSNIGT